YEAWQVDRDGMVTEGTSTNTWIVTAAGELVTRQTSHAILNGITRVALIELARKAQLRVVERPSSLAEATAAKGAVGTGTTSIVLPVVRIDDAAIGDGKPGPLGRRLRELYDAHAEGDAAA